MAGNNRTNWKKHGYAFMQQADVHGVSHYLQLSSTQKEQFKDFVATREAQAAPRPKPVDRRKAARGYQPPEVYMQRRLGVGINASA